MSQEPCSACGHDKIPTGANFCPNCGAPVSGEAPDLTDSSGSSAAPSDPDTVSIRTIADKLDEIAIWMGNEEGFYYLSPGFEAIWDRPVEDLYGDFSRLIETIHPQDRELVVQSIQDRSLYEDGPHVFEHRILRPDGTVRWIEARIFPIDTPRSPLPEVAGVSFDITDRKRAEQRLRKERTFIRQSIDAMSDLFYVISPEGRLMKWNRAATRVTGYSDEELAGKPLSEFSPEDEQQPIREAFEGIFETGPVRVEGNLVTAGGETIPYEFAGTPLSDADGNPRGIIGIGRDISDRIAREEALRYQRSMLDAVVESSIDGVLVVDEDREFVNYNQRFLDLWKVPEETMRAGNDQEVLDQWLDQIDRPEEFLERVEYLYDHPEKTARDEIQLADGRVMDRYTAPVRGGNGRYYGRVWFFRDVTQQKEYERRLKYERDFISQSLDAIPDLFYVIDPEGEPLRWNQAVVDVTGYSSDQISDMNTFEFFRQEDRGRIKQAMQNVLETGRDQVEAELVTADGEPIPYELTGSRFTDPEGNLRGIIGTGRDISERKTHEQVLEEQNKRLEQANQAKDRLMQEIHHRVKNNFQLASSLLGLQLRNTDNEEVQEILKDVRSRIQSMVSLHRILYQQEDVDRIRMEPYLEAIIDTVRENFQPTNSSVTIRRTLSDVPLSPERALHCGLILTELMMNSFEHAMAHRDEGQITIRFEEADGDLVLSVEDNGPGFADELEDLTSDSLGLKLVRALAVDQLGGTVSVDGSDGAHFEVRIPRNKPDD